MPIGRLASPRASLQPPVRLRPGATWLVALTLLVLAGSIVAPASAARARSSYDLTARYSAHLHLAWATRRVRLSTIIEVANSSGQAIDRLDLNTVAAKFGHLRRLQVSVDGARVPARVLGQTITVPLPEVLPAAGTARVRVAFRATLTTTVGGRSWLFAKLGGVAQLYRFIPWISRRVVFGSSNHGEPFVTAVSPRVEVTVSSDKRLAWATSGQRTHRLDARTSTFVAHDVRDFNVAASPNWRSSSGRSVDGKVRIVAHTRKHDGARLVRLARRELARYERLTGVPYGHPTYQIAETVGGLAMESPALIWIPSGRAAYDHPYLVSHETAHQWFYSTVGNDQSTDAFADEALAEYFARQAYLWFRPSRCATDRLDLEIRDYSDLCYYEVIYIQGARFLERLRKDFGSAAFRAAIRAYAKANRGRVSNDTRLLEAFRATMGNAVLRRYHARFPSLY
jgi:hypothetical protein